MTNNKRKFTLEIEALFKGDKAKENAKSLGKDITSILEDIGKSGDAMNYFRELVQYIGLIDSELSAFRSAHSDDFDKIFSGLDSNLQQQLEGIFQTTKANLTTIDQLRRRITDTETKIPKEGIKSLDKSEQGAIADEAKKIKSDVEGLYADLGKPITISNRLGPQKMLAEAKVYLNDFAREWDGVNERVARGLGVGVGGTGTGSAGGSNPITDELDEMSQNIKNSIRELENQIEKLKEQKEGLTKILNDSQNIKSDDVDLSVDAVRKLVDEYETLSNSIKNVDHSSDEYYNSLARIVEVSSKMNAALKKLKQSDDSVKEIFRNTVLFEGEGVRKTLFGQLAAGGGDQVYKDWRTRAKNKRDTYNIAIDEKTTQIRDLKVTEAQIEQNKKLGLSYKSLAKYAIDYMNISSKVGRGDTLTNDDEKLMSQMAKDLKAFAKAKKIAMQDLDDIFAKAETGGFADEDAMLKELCKTLGVQIPKNAQKAKDAVKELDNVADTIGVSSDSSDNSGLRTGSSSDNGVSDTVLSNLESTIKQEILSIRDKMGELDISEIINGIKQEIGSLSDKLDFSNLEEVIRGELSSTNTNIHEAASRIVAAILGDGGTTPGDTNGAGGTTNSSRNNRGMSGVEQDVKSSGAPKETTYQDKLNTVNQITKAYDKYYTAKDKFDNADDGKAAERAEESFERAKENLELYQDKYHSVMATMEDGSKMHIPLDDSFDQEIRNILDDADKIKDIDLVPKSAGAAVEGYEAIDRAIEKISTRTKDIDNLDQKVGYFKDSAIQEHLSYLQKAKSDIESQDSNFIYGSKDKYNQATSLISKLETLSSRQSLYNDFKDNIVNTDKFREFNATGEHVRTVLDGIKDGTFTTVEQCVAKLKELGGAIDNVGDSSQVQPAEEVVSKIASTEGESNATSEIASLEMLDTKLKEVKTAIEAKTQAFRDEGSVVDEIVASEKQSLEGLATKLTEVSTQAKLVGDSFQQIQQLSSLSNATTTDNKQTDTVTDGTTTTSGIVNDQTYNVSSEIEQLSVLEQKVNEVKAAIESKTQAFKEEGTVVDTVITKELEALEVLSTYLDVIRLTINEVVSGLNLIKSTNLNELQNDSVNDIENTTTSNAQEINNKYALDSTLSTTNSILQSILTVVSGDESTDQISKVLDGAVLDLKAAADALRTSANEVKQESKKGTKSKPKDDKPTTSKKRGKEDELTFDEIKNNEISNFEKYKKDVENSIHVTDQFKNKLSELELQLKDVDDVEDLNTWKQNVEKFQGAFGIHESASKKQLIGEINDINKDAKDAIKGLDLNELSDDTERRAAQERIIQGFKEIQIASDICTNSVKKNQYDEISAFNAAKQQLAEKKKQLLEEAAIYRQQYGFMNGGKSGKNYGSTAVMRETTRYNKFKQYASDENQGFKDSTLFNEKLQQYINAYDRLIAKRQEISNKSVRTDRDEQEFNDAKQAAADYGKELDKMIAKSNKLMSNSYNQGKIGSDIDVEDALSRKKALTDFVTGMHDASESTIKFSNDYQECTFKMKNSEGTFTKMTATLDKTTHKMYSVAGEVTKYKTAFGEFIGSLKGEFLKLGRYMVASFGIQEVIQAVRMGVGYVKEIDNALTDLKKVTNETDAGYERFLQTMSKTAAVVGSTVAELTTMAAEWARLGWILNQPHYIVIYK